MKRKREKAIIIASIIGEGIHSGLRKMGQSVSANTAWFMIKDMPNEEWGAICKMVADEVISVLDNEDERDEK